MSLAVAGSSATRRVGIGHYDGIFRELLPAMASPERLKLLVRTPNAVLAALVFHLQDQHANLSEHERLLLSVLGDVVSAPYGGQAACSAVALHATCYLAVHGEVPAGLGNRLGLMAMERQYPTANYEDEEAGACIDLFKLYHQRHNPGERSKMALVKVG
jgi:hypothetical protein